MRNVAIDDLYNSKQQEMDSDDMEDEEYMKKGDLAAALVHSGGEICLCVIEVKEFQFGTEKVSHVTAALDDLEDISKSIKVIGQIIALEPSTTKADFWEWTWDYISVHIQNDQLTRQQYAVEIPSFFIHPLAPSVVDKPASGSSADHKHYPTWRLSTTDLQNVLDSLWDSLEPDTDRVVGNAHLLLSTKNPDGLPYCHPTNGTKYFFVTTLPDSLKVQKKHNANDKLPCYFCREEVKLSKMWNHVGGHILCSLLGAEDAKIKAYWKQRERAAAQGHDTSDIDELQQIGENPCGFCGLDGCFTSLLEKKFGNSIKFTITSNCHYHYERMQYKNAAVFSKNMPCTNIPIHCPVCPLSFSGNPQTIWKYNALYHLISEHFSNGIIPEIPGELLVKMFIHKAEEDALGIDQNATERYRRDNQIPDSDGFAMIMPKEKRGRSETMSTNLSDNHDTNRPRYSGIPEAVLE